MVKEYFGSVLSVVCWRVTYLYIKKSLIEVIIYLIWGNCSSEVDDRKGFLVKSYLEPV